MMIRLFRFYAIALAAFLGTAACGSEHTILQPETRLDAGSTIAADTCSAGACSGISSTNGASSVTVTPAITGSTGGVGGSAVGQSSGTAGAGGAKVPLGSGAGAGGQEVVNSAGAGGSASAVTSAAGASGGAAEAAGAGGQSEQPIDAGPVTNSVCSGQTGVAVSGTISFNGSAPTGARLWLYWKTPEGGIPPCSMEISPLHFPARFHFEQVPAGKGWLLDVFIDRDGGFPPIPTSGDYILNVPGADIDLSHEVTGLALSIPTTPPT
jgi:hypothetical protein